MYAYIDTRCMNIRVQKNIILARVLLKVGLLYVRNNCVDNWSVSCTVHISVKNVLSVHIFCVPKTVSLNFCPIGQNFHEVYILFLCEIFLYSFPCLLCVIYLWSISVIPTIVSKLTNVGALCWLGNFSCAILSMVVNFANINDTSAYRWDYGLKKLSSL